MWKRLIRKKLDDKIRMIVKEELVACLGDILYLMEQHTTKTDSTGNIVKDKRAYSDEEIIDTVRDKLEYDIEVMERESRED